MPFEIPFLLGLCTLAAAKAKVTVYNEASCQSAVNRTVEADTNERCKDIGYTGESSDGPTVLVEPGHDEIVELFQDFARVDLSG